MVMSTAEIQYPWRALPALAEVVKPFLMPLDLPIVLEEVLDQVGSFGYPICSVLLVDSKTQELHVRVQQGNPKMTKNRRFRIADRGIDAWVARVGQPHYAPDVRRDPLTFEAAPAARSEAAFPLIAENRLIGVLDIESPKIDAFPPEAREALRAFASVAALAIFRAQREEELHHLALTDDLTGLKNHRGLGEALEQEAARAGRFGQPLSAVLIEIDKFKRINDRYGHMRGDTVLRAAAGAMKKSCRTMDLAGRFGGDEFVLLLPETSKGAAAGVAERLRRQLEELSLPEGIRVTASFGVASLPQDATTTDGLLEAADRAMYQAKHTGGNRVGLV